MLHKEALDLVHAARSQDLIDIQFMEIHVSHFFMNRFKHGRLYKSLTLAVSAMPSGTPPSSCPAYANSSPLIVAFLA